VKREREREREREDISLQLALLLDHLIRLNSVNMGLTSGELGVHKVQMFGQCCN